MVAALLHASVCALTNFERKLKRNAKVRLMCDRRHGMCQVINVLICFVAVDAHKFNLHYYCAHSVNVS